LKHYRLQTAAPLLLKNCTETNRTSVTTKRVIKDGIVIYEIKIPCLSVNLRRRAMSDE